YRRPILQRRIYRLAFRDVKPRNSLRRSTRCVTHTGHLRYRRLASNPREIEKALLASIEWAVVPRYVLSGGRIVLGGAPSDLAHSEELERAFMGAEAD